MFNKKIFLFLFLSTIFIISTNNSSFAGKLGPLDLVESDTENSIVYAFIDLRDRESYVQITNTSSFPITIHVQIFNVDDDCNENNFFDTLTPNDTHTYNMNDIQTNNGNPSGVVLPSNAYGIVAIGVINDMGGFDLTNRALIGNFRILDSVGYEYRTNMGSRQNNPNLPNENHIITFNFNSEAGFDLSEFVLIGVDFVEVDGEVVAANLKDVNNVFDVDILNNNEVVFSCRDVAFACTDQDNPGLEELLEFLSFVGVSVASFEYGINEALPHSKGKELLCPGNNIQEGIVRLISEFETTEDTVGYIGLNNGNGRGSMDSIFLHNYLFVLENGNPNN